MLGTRITQLRKKNKYTQEVVASHLGIPRSTYSNYESGKREPDLQTINALATFFDVTVDYLTGRTKDPNQSMSGGAKVFMEALKMDDDEAIKSLSGLLEDDEGNIISDDALRQILAHTRFVLSEERRKLNKK